MATSWIRDELAKVDLGDQRLNERLFKIGEKFLEVPLLSISQGQGEWASSKAAYRFFENDKSSEKLILQPHIDQTCIRVRQAQDTVLAIQDTTCLDYSQFPSIEGLAEIYRNQKTWKDSEGGQGFMAHTTLAVTAEGLPLGLLGQKFYLRNKQSEKGESKHKPIEEKESFRWIESINETARQLPEARIVHVCDREGDIFEAFFHAQQQNVNFLIRASIDRVVGHRFHSRAATKNTTLWDYMKTKPLALALIIDVEKTVKTAARKAQCELRFEKIIFTPPKKNPGAKSTLLFPVEVYAVWIREINAPREIDPLEWMLLTNIPVITVSDALEKIKWYRSRWHIENFFKILKSGCKVEETRLDSFDKLKKFITLKSIIAFRIYWMTWLNRISPESDCRVVLSEQEWKALYCFKNKTRTTPKDPPKVGEIILWIAKLGGFLGRKGDGQPGATVIWRGWQELTKITQTWEIFNDCAATYG